MKTTSFILLSWLSFSAIAQNDTNVVILKIPLVTKDRTKDSTASEPADPNQRPAQFSFFYPLGSNGIESPRIENNFSLNALYGINGGVEGAEIGGLVNVNQGDVNGVQIGGIANVTNGTTNGTVVGGIANIVTDSSKAILIAGISNVVGDSSAGFHIAGISNTVNGSFDGGQIAGIGNLNNGPMDGFQLAGISNVNNGNVNGLQLSGIANIVHGETTGAQVGFINFSSRMNGAQIGFINAAGESENAIPVGFLSLVKNGYQALEFSTNESFYGNVTLKLGVEKFYNSFRVGIGSEQGDSYLSYGYGIGTLISFDEKNKLGLDLSANTILQNFWNNWDLDLLNRFELTYQRFIGKHFTVFGGPVLNVYVTQTMVDGTYGTIHVPYTIYSENWWNGNTSMWIGVHAGGAIRF